MKHKKATIEQLVELTAINTGHDPAASKSRKSGQMNAVGYFVKLGAAAGYSDRELAKAIGKERTTILHHRRKK